MNQFDAYRMLLRDGFNEFDAYDLLADQGYDPHEKSAPRPMTPLLLLQLVNRWKDQCHRSLHLD